MSVNMDRTGIEPAVSCLQNRRHPIATSSPYACLWNRTKTFWASTRRFYQVSLTGRTKSSSESSVVNRLFIFQCSFPFILRVPVYGDNGFSGDRTRVLMINSHALPPAELKTQIFIKKSPAGLFSFRRS